MAFDILSSLDAASVSVNNSSPTAVTCPLNGARQVQIYIDPEGTQQAFTVELSNGHTIPVPSGQGLAVPLPGPGYILAGDTLFTVQTATGTVDLKVLASA